MLYVAMKAALSGLIVAIVSEIANEAPHWCACCLAADRFGLSSDGALAGHW